MLKRSGRNNHTLYRYMLLLLIGALAASLLIGFLHLKEARAASGAPEAREARRPRHAPGMPTEGGVLRTPPPPRGV
jgi:hypothetical protein